MSERLRQAILYLVFMFLSASLFTACSGISVSGGLVGSLLSLFGIVMLVFTLSTTQSGCDVGPCLSAPLPDAQAPMDGGGQDTKVGPCLSPPPPDVRNPPQDTKVGPCLSPPPPDVRNPQDTNPPPDTKVGPCLSPPPPDAKEPKDAGPAPDAKVGPCLSPPPPDKMGRLDDKKPSNLPQMEQSKRYAANTRDAERGSAIEKLRAKGVLPADVAARLKGTNDKKA